MLNEFFNSISQKIGGDRMSKNWRWSPPVYL